MLTQPTIRAAAALPVERLASVLLDLEAGAAEAADVVAGYVAGNDPNKYAELSVLLARGDNA